jgi:hypothetical protein
MVRHPRLALAIASLGFVAMAGSANEGCRTATQVTVEIRTVGALPCTSLLGVAIAVAATPAEAEERMRLGSYSAEVGAATCEANGRTVGTLVITPKGSTAAIVVRARYSETCKAPDFVGCIFSRRSFAFVDHASLTMPISLEVACVDVPCDVESSCRSGTCKPSRAECAEESGTCESEAEPVVTPDGQVVPPDAEADGMAGDSGTPDGSSDAPLDVPADAPMDVKRDVRNDPPGNGCPVNGSSVDCNVNNGMCCYMGSFFCQPMCTPGYYKFACVGRGPCPGGNFCCGNPLDGTPPGASCDITAGQACTQNGNHYICTTDGDCPPSRPRCDGVYYASPGDAGTIKECH